MILSRLAFIIAIALSSRVALAHPYHHDLPRTLTIGSVAPPLDAAHWIHGSPITAYEPGRIYVLDCWALWSPACRDHIDLLSALQLRYAERNVSIMGVADGELPDIIDFLCQRSDPDDPEAPVWNDRIRYAFAADGDQSTVRAYLFAAGWNTLPCTMIIGPDGRIEWIGEPDDLPGILEQVVAGAWDRAAFHATWEAEQKVNDRIRAEARIFSAHMREGTWDAALASVDRLIALAPERLSFRTARFRLLLAELDRPDEAYGLCDALMTEAWDDARSLNALAWSIVDLGKEGNRDLDRALRCAERADELTASRDGLILDTLARVRHARGDVMGAVRTQRQAVRYAPNDRVRELNHAVLLRYEQEAGVAHHHHGDEAHDATDHAHEDSADHSEDHHAHAHDDTNEDGRHAKLIGFVRDLPATHEYVRLLARPECLALHAGFVTLQPGENCGWHSTERYEEMIICLEGSGRLESEDAAPLPLAAGQYGYNPPHTRHCVFNTSGKPMRYIYIVAPTEPAHDEDAR